MTRLLILALVLTTTISGCSQLDDTSIIRDQLQALADSPDPESFLIIEDEKSQKFVQFAGPELQFDLPKQTLSDEEFATAKKLLHQYDIEPITYMLQNPETGEMDFPQTTFQRELDGNVELAEELAKVVLFQVYGFDQEYPFNFIENEYHPNQPSEVVRQR